MLREICAPGRGVLSPLLSFGGRVSSRAFSAGVQLVIFVILSRDIGTSQLGLFVQYVSIATLATSVLGFGFRYQCLTLPALDKPRARFTTMLLCRMICSILVILVMGIAGLVLGGSILCFSAAVFVSIDFVSDVLSNGLAGLDSQKLASVLIFCQRLPSVALCAFFSAPVAVALGGMVWICVACSILVGMWVSPFPLRTILREGIPYWIASVSVNFSQLDTTIIRLASGVAFVASFGLANRIASLFNIINSSIITILVPALSSRRNGDELFRRVFMVGLVYATLVVVFAPVANLAMSLVISVDEYPWLTSFVWAVCIAAALSGVTQVVQAFSLAKMRGWSVALSLLAGSVVYVLLLMCGLWSSGPGYIVFALIGAQLVTLSFSLSSSWRRIRRSGLSRG